METFDVAFPLTARALRIIKSYATLSGKQMKDVATELGELVSASLEEELKRRIGVELGLDTKAAPRTATPYIDTTGISEGLGDEEPEEIPATQDETAFIPQTGGVSDADLDNDMSVDDPRHEAKAEAAHAVVDANSVFAEVAGFVDPTVKTRARSRKKPVGGKGKVSPMNIHENEATT